MSKEDDLRDEVEERLHELEDEAEAAEEAAEDAQAAADEEGSKERRNTKRAEAASMIPEVGPVAGAAMEQEADKHRRKRQEAEREAEEAREHAREAKQAMSEVEAERRRAEREAQRARDDLRGSDPAGSSTIASGFYPWLALYLTLAFHLFDGWYFDFSTDLYASSVRIFFYTVVAAGWYLLGVTQGSFNREPWLLALIEIAGPFILVLFELGLSFLPVGVGISALKTIYWFTPIFALRLSTLRNGRIFVIWMFAIVILAVILMLNFLVMNPVLPSTPSDLDISQAASDFWNQINDAVTGIYTGVDEGVERSLDYATGGYYTGMVEDTKDEQVGVYIENTRFSQERFFPGDDVYAYADIRGKSFKEEITVTPSCIARQDDTTIRGEAEPEQFSFYAEDFKNVQCALGNLSSGNWDVDFTAGFNFETWSYVTYTFVDQQTRLNYLQQDQNINQELDIPSGLRPVYTPGPVQLGMSSDIPQPVGVADELNTLFGVTLDNRWTDGAVTRVKSFDVLIPDAFRLANCDAEPQELDQAPICAEDPEKCPDNMRAYRFDHPDTLDRFTTFNCRLRLDGGDVDDVVPAAQKKAQKTFVVKASYDYALTEDMDVEVEDAE